MPKPMRFSLAKVHRCQHNWALFPQTKLPVKPRAALGAPGMLVWLWDAWITSVCLHSTGGRVTIHLEKHFIFLI